MMIIEHDVDYPITILNKERYDYYKDCERKSKLTDEEIRKEAMDLFKEWSAYPDFKVEISMMNLDKTFKYDSKTSFFAEWYRDRWWSNKEMENPRFRFDKALNDSVNEFISEAYKEHRKELESEFCARTSKRAKSYQRMRRMAVWQWGIILALIISNILTWIL